MSAFCAWVSDYGHAKKSGNTLKASKAASEVANAMAWPAVRAELSYPLKWSVFGWFLPFQRVVASGTRPKFCERWHVPITLVRNSYRHRETSVLRRLEFAP